MTNTATIECGKCHGIDTTTGCVSCDPNLPRCQNCHGAYNVHGDCDCNYRLPSTPIKQSARRIDLNCRKCNGTGYIATYSHIQNGVCFLCQ